MTADPRARATKVDIATLLRYPHGTDREIVKIYLEYNDILVGKGIGSYNIWMKRANYLYALEELEEAVVAIDMALAHEARNAEAHFLKGVCLQLLALRESGGSLDQPLGELPTRLLNQAKLSFERALYFNPQDHEAGTYITNLRCILYSPSATAEPETASAASPGDDPVGAVA